MIEVAALNPSGCEIGYAETKPHRNQNALLSRWPPAHPANSVSVENTSESMMNTAQIPLGMALRLCEVCRLYLIVSHQRSCFADHLSRHPNRVHGLVLPKLFRGAVL